MKRVAVFVDVQNIYYTTRHAYQNQFNYNAFWARISEGREIVKACAYAIDRGDPKQRQFQNILKAIGFEVKLKPYIQRSDGSSKGDWDVGITLDVMETAPEVDVVVLATGDGDFDLLLERIKQRYRTKTEVYGVPALTATSLIHAAWEYIPIDEALLMPRRTP